MQALSEENYLLRFITKRESKLLSATVFSVASGLKFIYSEKATEFCEIFPLLLTVCTVVKSKGKISQNFVTFSEYMNFNCPKRSRYYCFQYSTCNFYFSHRQQIRQIWRHKEAKSLVSQVSTSGIQKKITSQTSKNLHPFLIKNTKYVRETLLHIEFKLQCTFNSNFNV